MANGLSRTGVIRFNVKERGRRFRGQDRNFDTAALASIINGGAVQERVANGDLYGFYGHWPREKFGMEPMEGGFIGGKRVNLEPSHRTVYLKAFPDGTVEHQEEFLDTDSGRLAERMFKTKAGGFSSAIVAPRRGAVQVPQDFHGFDFVLEPNYTTNRGYTLDSANLSEEECLVLDEVDHYNAFVRSTNAILDGIQADYDRLDEVAMRLEQENAELRAMLSRKSPAASVVLDGVLDIVSHATSSRFDQADAFFDAELAGFEPAKKEESPPAKKTAADKFLSKAFGL